MLSILLDLFISTVHSQFFSFSSNLDHINNIHVCIFCLQIWRTHFNMTLRPRKTVGKFICVFCFVYAPLCDGPKIHLFVILCTRSNESSATLHSATRYTFYVTRELTENDKCSHAITQYRNVLVVSYLSGPLEQYYTWIYINKASTSTGQMALQTRNGSKILTIIQ